MKLLTKAIEARFAALGEQDTPDAVVVCKFFAPWSNWTWFATSYQAKDRTFFGLVDGLEIELGYFSRDELESVVGRFGLRIERDLHWHEQPLKDVQAACERARGGG